MDNLELVKEECKIQKCNFVNIDSVYSCFYIKLSEVFETKVHEQKKIKCGLIFSEDIISNVKYRKRITINDNITDGESVFEHIDTNGNSECIIFDKKLSHVNLALMSKSNNTIIVRKTETEIFIYYKATIYIIEDRKWSYRQNLELFSKKLKYILPSLDDEIFSKILDYAIYELSLNKIGTTIVYNTTKRFPLKDITRKEKCNLSITDVKDQKLIKNYLSYHDGAILLKMNGKVIYVNAFLNSKPSKNIKYKSSGTRHTSACNFSYRNRNTVIVTVSEDGPISVFFRGNELSNITITTNYAFSYNLESYGQMAKDIDEVVNYGYETVTCPKCKTKYDIQYMTMTGNNDSEELYCEICGEQYYNMHCFILEGKIKSIKMGK